MIYAIGLAIAATLATLAVLIWRNERSVDSGLARIGDEARATGFGIGAVVIVVALIVYAFCQ